MRLTREPCTCLGKISARPHQRAVALARLQEPRHLGKYSCHHGQRSATSPCARKSSMPKPGLQTKEETHGLFLGSTRSSARLTAVRGRPQQRFCLERGRRSTRDCQERGPRSTGDSTERGPQSEGDGTNERGPRSEPNRSAVS
jgi:hypothetical protein